MTQHKNFYVVHNCGMKHRNIKVLGIVLACLLCFPFRYHKPCEHPQPTSVLHNDIIDANLSLQHAAAEKKDLLWKVSRLNKPETVSLYHLGMGSIPSHLTPANQLRLFGICPSSEPHQQILIPSTQF